MHPNVQMPVPPPPDTIPKVKNVTKIKKDPIIEKDESLIASVADGIRREAESCFKTAVVEENWEEKHKLLLDEFIRQEEESKFNLSGQEEQVLQSFLTSNKCKMERAGKRFEKKVDPPPPPSGCRWQVIRFSQLFSWLSYSCSIRLRNYHGGPTSSWPS